MSWLSRLVQSESPEPGVATVRSVKFDTRGCRLESRAPLRVEWRDLDEDAIVATVDRESIDREPSVLDINALIAWHRDKAGAAGGGLVSVDVVSLGGTAVARVLTKYNDSPSYLYEGTLVMRLRDARFTLTMRAREHSTTGTREAVIFSHLLSHGVLRIPGGPAGPGPRRIDGWSLDPYDAAHDGQALCSLADDERWDDLMPKHPLTKVRRWLRTVVETMTIDETVRVEGEAPLLPPPARTRLSKQISLATVGLLYLTADRLDAAERYFAESIPLEDGEPAMNDVDVAGNLTLLGHAREMQGKFVGAEWAMARAHRIYHDAFGDTDVRTARAISNLARIYVSLSRFADARPLFVAALPVLQQRGTDVDAAVALNGLGLVCRAASEEREAIGFFRRADTHFEKAEIVRGQPIADRATVLLNLSGALDAVGDRHGAAEARARARAVGQLPPR